MFVALQCVHIPSAINCVHSAPYFDLCSALKQSQYVLKSAEEPDGFVCFNHRCTQRFLPFFVLPGRIFFATGSGATGFGSPEPEFDAGMAGGTVVGGSETAVVETARVVVGVALLFTSAAL